MYWSESGTLVVVVALSSALSAISGHAWISLAHRTGLVDTGDGVLKLQPWPVPYFGGPMVLVAASLGLAAPGALHPSLLGVWIAAALATAIGLVDDAFRLGVGAKLTGQVALGVLLSTGQDPVRLGWLPPPVDAILTVVWIVAVINAFNFLDVVDGLCAAVAAALALTLGTWAAGTQAPEAVLCAALAGAALGFLRFNWRPAEMYLGDSGSMLFGLLFAAIPLRLDWSRHTSVAAVIAPLAMISVPLFELTFVIACRLRLSLPPHLGSPDHSAVRLRVNGLTADAIVYRATAATLISGAGALVAATGPAAVAVAIGAGGIAACVVASVWLWRLDPRRPHSVDDSRVEHRAPLGVEKMAK